MARRTPTQTSGWCWQLKKRVRNMPKENIERAIRRGAGEEKMASIRRNHYEDTVRTVWR